MLHYVSHVACLFFFSFVPLPVVTAGILATLTQANRNQVQFFLKIDSLIFKIPITIPGKRSPEKT